MKTLSYEALPLRHDTMQVKSGELYTNKREKIHAECKRTGKQGSPELILDYEAQGACV